MAETYVATDAANNWAARLTIPASTPSGAYRLFAECHGPSRDTGTAFYPSVPITVA